MEPMKNIPVYRHSAAYAVEHGELEAYKMSRVAGVACRDAIDVYKRQVPYSIRRCRSASRG